MAIVKFKSGDKATLLGNATVTPAVLPLPIDAGTVYFAIDENDKGSIYFDKDATHRIVMSEAYAEYAETANKDMFNNPIAATYLKDITFASETDTTDNKIKVIATLTTGNGNATTKRVLPIAGTNLAGIITPDTQTIAGAKTFTGAATFSGGITFSNINFNYSSIEAGTTDSARVVWFADASKKGKPVYDNDFTYNPYTNTVKADYFDGVATYATYDGNGSTTLINTYLHDVTSSDMSLTFTRGNGNTIPISLQAAVIRRWS